MLVSVVIPASPPARFLRQAVLSALNATPMAPEVVVVEDRCDTSGEIGDLPVRRIRSRCPGMAAARNTGIEECTGRYVTFLDSDDLLSTDSLGWRAAYLDRHDAPWVAGLVEAYIDADGQEVSPPVRPTPPPACLDLDFFKQGGGISVACWSVMARRERIPRFDESLTVVPDTALLLDMVRLHPIPLLPRPVIRYRLHGDNTSGEWKEGQHRYHRRTVAESLLVNLSCGIGTPP